MISGKDKLTNLFNTTVPIQRITWKNKHCTLCLDDPQNTFFYKGTSSEKVEKVAFSAVHLKQHLLPFLIKSVVCMCYVYVFYNSPMFNLYFPLN